MFTYEDLHQVTFSVYLERRLVRYLQSFRTALIQLYYNRNSLSRRLRNLGQSIFGFAPTAKKVDRPPPPPVDCILKGMGLIVAVQERRASFYIYFLQPQHSYTLLIHQQQYDPETADIAVCIRGPLGDYGEVIIHDLNAIKSSSNRSLNFSATKSTCNIPINYRLSSRYIRINYMPQNSGIHELSVLRRGYHLPGSPFLVTADRKSQYAMPLSSGFSDEEEYSRNKANRRRLRVMFRVVDFVTEKMILTEDGRLEKLPVLMSERILTCRTSLTSSERSGSSIDSLEAIDGGDERLYPLKEIENEYPERVCAIVKKSPTIKPKLGRDNKNLLKGRWRKVMLLCRFFAKHGSDQKRLQILRAAGHIFDGRPVRLTESTLNLIEKAVSAMPDITEDASCQTLTDQTINDTNPYQSEINIKGNHSDNKQKFTFNENHEELINILPTEGISSLDGSSTHVDSLETQGLESVTMQDPSMEGLRNLYKSPKNLGLNFIAHLEAEEQQTAIATRRAMRSQHRKDIARIYETDVESIKSGTSSNKLNSLPECADRGSESNKVKQVEPSPKMNSTTPPNKKNENETEHLRDTSTLSYKPDVMARDKVCGELQTKEFSESTRAESILVFSGESEGDSEAGERLERIDNGAQLHNTYRMKLGESAHLDSITDQISTDKPSINYQDKSIKSERLLHLEAQSYAGSKENCHEDRSPEDPLTQDDSVVALKMNTSDETNERCFSANVTKDRECSQDRLHENDIQQHNMVAKTSASEPILNISKDNETVMQMPSNISSDCPSTVVKSMIMKFEILQKEISTEALTERVNPNNSVQRHLTDLQQTRCASDYAQTKLSDVEEEDENENTQVKLTEYEPVSNITPDGHQQNAMEDEQMHILLSQTEDVSSNVKHKMTEKSDFPSLKRDNMSTSEAETSTTTCHSQEELKPLSSRDNEHNIQEATIVSLSCSSPKYSPDGVNEDIYDIISKGDTEASLSDCENMLPQIKPELSLESHIAQQETYKDYYKIQDTSGPQDKSQNTSFSTSSAVHVLEEESTVTPKESFNGASKSSTTQNILKDNLELHTLQKQSTPLESQLLEREIFSDCSNPDSDMLYSNQETSPTLTELRFASLSSAENENKDQINITKNADSFPCDMLSIKEQSNSINNFPEIFPDCEPETLGAEGCLYADVQDNLKENLTAATKPESSTLSCSAHTGFHKDAKMEERSKTGASKQPSHANNTISQVKTPELEMPPSDRQTKPSENSEYIQNCKIRSPNNEEKDDFACIKTHHCNEQTSILPNEKKSSTLNSDNECSKKCKEDTNEKRKIDNLKCSSDSDCNMSYDKYLEPNILPMKDKSSDEDDVCCKSSASSNVQESCFLISTHHPDTNGINMPSSHTECEPDKNVWSECITVNENYGIVAERSIDCTTEKISIKEIDLESLSDISAANIQETAVIAEESDDTPPAYAANMQESVSTLQEEGEGIMPIYVPEVELHCPMTITEGDINSSKMELVVEEREMVIQESTAEGPIFAIADNVDKIVDVLKEPNAEVSTYESATASMSVNSREQKEDNLQNVEYLECAFVIAIEQGSVDETEICIDTSLSTLIASVEETAKNLQELDTKTVTDSKDSALNVKETFTASAKNSSAGLTAENETILKEETSMSTFIRDHRDSETDVDYSLFTSTVTTNGKETKADCSVSVDASSIDENTLTIAAEENIISDVENTFVSCAHDELEIQFALKGDTESSLSCSAVVERNLVNVKEANDQTCEKAVSEMDTESFLANSNIIAENNVMELKKMHESSSPVLVAHQSTTGLKEKDISSLFAFPNTVKDNLLYLNEADVEPPESMLADGVQEGEVVEEGENNKPLISTAAISESESDIATLFSTSTSGNKECLKDQSKICAKSIIPASITTAEETTIVTEKAAVHIVKSIVDEKEGNIETLAHVSAVTVKENTIVPKNNNTEPFPNHTGESEELLQPSLTASIRNIEETPISIKETDDTVSVFMYNADVGESAVLKKPTIDQSGIKESQVILGKTDIETTKSSPTAIVEMQRSTIQNDTNVHSSLFTSAMDTKEETALLKNVDIQALVDNIPTIAEKRTVLNEACTKSPAENSPLLLKEPDIEPKTIIHSLIDNSLENNGKEQRDSVQNGSTLSPTAFVHTKHGNGGPPDLWSTKETDKKMDSVELLNGGQTLSLGILSPEHAFENNATSEEIIVCNPDATSFVCLSGAKKEETQISTQEALNSHVGDSFYEYAPNVCTVNPEEKLAYNPWTTPLICSTVERSPTDRHKTEVIDDKLACNPWATASTDRSAVQQGMFETSDFIKPIYDLHEPTLSLNDVNDDLLDDCNNMLSSESIVPAVRQVMLTAAAEDVVADKNFQETNESLPPGGNALKCNDAESSKYETYTAMPESLQEDISASSDEQTSENIQTPAETFHGRKLETIDRHQCEVQNIELEVQELDGSALYLDRSCSSSEEPFKQHNVKDSDIFSYESQNKSSNSLYNNECSENIFMKDKFPKGDNETEHAEETFYTTKTLIATAFPESITLSSAQEKKDGKPNMLIDIISFEDNSKENNNTEDVQINSNKSNTEHITEDTKKKWQQIESSETCNNASNNFQMQETAHSRGELISNKRLSSEDDISSTKDAITLASQSLPENISLEDSSTENEVAGTESISSQFSHINPTFFKEESSVADGTELEMQEDNTLLNLHQRNQELNAVTEDYEDTLFSKKDELVFPASVNANISANVQSLQEIERDKDTGEVENERRSKNITKEEILAFEDLKIIISPPSPKLKTIPPPSYEDVIRSEQEFSSVSPPSPKTKAIPPPSYEDVVRSQQELSSANDACEPENDQVINKCNGGKGNEPTDFEYLTFYKDQISAMEALEQFSSEGFEERKEPHDKVTKPEILTDYDDEVSVELAALSATEFSDKSDSADIQLKTCKARTASPEQITNQMEHKQFSQIPDVNKLQNDLMAEGHLLDLVSSKEIIEQAPALSEKVTAVEHEVKVTSDICQINEIQFEATTHSLRPGFPKGSAECTSDGFSDSEYTYTSEEIMASQKNEKQGDETSISAVNSQQDGDTSSYCFPEDGLPFPSLLEENKLLAETHNIFNCESFNVTETKHEFDGQAIIQLSENSTEVKVLIQNTKPVENNSVFEEKENQVYPETINLEWTEYSDNTQRERLHKNEINTTLQTNEKRTLLLSEEPVNGQSLSKSTKTQNNEEIPRISTAEAAQYELRITDTHQESCPNMVGHNIDDCMKEASLSTATQPALDWEKGMSMPFSEKTLDSEESGFPQGVIAETIGSKNVHQSSNDGKCDSVIELTSTASASNREALHKEHLNKTTELVNDWLDTSYLANRGNFLTDSNNFSSLNNSTDEIVTCSEEDRDPEMQKRHDTETKELGQLTADVTLTTSETENKSSKQVQEEEPFLGETLFISNDGHSSSDILVSALVDSTLTTAILTSPPSRINEPAAHGVEISMIENDNTNPHESNLTLSEMPDTCLDERCPTSLSEGKEVALSMYSVLDTHPCSSVLPSSFPLLGPEDGPVLASSPSEYNSENSICLFPDLDDILSKDFTAYMSNSGDQFHLWPSDVAFGSPSSNIDENIDFDSVLAAPNLEEALRKLEHDIKKRKEENLPSGLYPEEKSESEINYDKFLNADVDNDESSSSPSIPWNGEEDHNLADVGNMGDINQEHDQEHGHAEDDNLSYDIGDSDYVSLDDIQGSFKQSPDSRDTDDGRNFSSPSANSRKLKNFGYTQEQEARHMQRESDAAARGLMGPAEKEIWGISDVQSDDKDKAREGTVNVEECQDTVESEQAHSVDDNGQDSDDSNKEADDVDWTAALSNFKSYPRVLSPALAPTMSAIVEEMEEGCSNSKGGKSLAHTEADTSHNTLSPSHRNYEQPSSPPLCFDERGSDCDMRNTVSETTVGVVTSLKMGSQKANKDTKQSECFDVPSEAATEILVSINEIPVEAACGNTGVTVNKELDLVRAVRFNTTKEGPLDSTKIVTAEQQQRKICVSESKNIHCEESRQSPPIMDTDHSEKLNAMGANDPVFLIPDSETVQVQNETANSVPSEMNSSEPLRFIAVSSKICSISEAVSNNLVNKEIQIGESSQYDEAIPHNNEPNRTLVNEELKDNSVEENDCLPNLHLGSTKNETETKTCKMGTSEERNVTSTLITDAVPYTTSFEIAECGYTGATISNVKSRSKPVVHKDSSSPGTVIQNTTRGDTVHERISWNDKETSGESKINDQETTAAHLNNSFNSFGVNEKTKEETRTPENTVCIAHPVSLEKDIGSFAETAVFPTESLPDNVNISDSSKRQEQLLHGASCQTPIISLSTNEYPKSVVTISVVNVVKDVQTVHQNNDNYLDMSNNTKNATDLQIPTTQALYSVPCEANDSELLSQEDVSTEKFANKVDEIFNEILGPELIDSFDSTEDNQMIHSADSTAIMLTDVLLAADEGSTGDKSLVGHLDADDSQNIGETSEETFAGDMIEPDSSKHEAVQFPLPPIITVSEVCTDDGTDAFGSSAQTAENVMEKDLLQFGLTERPLVMAMRVARRRQYWDDILRLAIEQNDQQNIGKQIHQPKQKSAGLTQSEIYKKLCRKSKCAALRTRKPISVRIHGIVSKWRLAFETLKFLEEPGRETNKQQDDSKEKQNSSNIVEHWKKYWDDLVEEQAQIARYRETNKEEITKQYKAGEKRTLRVTGVVAVGRERFENISSETSEKKHKDAIRKRRPRRCDRNMKSSSPSPDRSAKSYGKTSIQLDSNTVIVPISLQNEANDDSVNLICNTNVNLNPILTLEQGDSSIKHTDDPAVSENQNESSTVTSITVLTQFEQEEATIVGLHACNIPNSLENVTNDDSMKFICNKNMDFNPTLTPEQDDSSLNHADDPAVSEKRNESSNMPSITVPKQFEQEEPTITHTVDVSKHTENLHNESESTSFTKSVSSEINKEQNENQRHGPKEFKSTMTSTNEFKDGATRQKPQKDPETKNRFQQAKHFFQMLEQNASPISNNSTSRIRPVGYRKGKKSDTIAQGPAEAWGSTQSLKGPPATRQNTEVPYTRPSSVSSAPAYETWGSTQSLKDQKTFESNSRGEKNSSPSSSSESLSRSFPFKKIRSTVGGSERCAKVYEKFHVEDLFRDVFGESGRSCGSLKGIPHKQAVLASLQSVGDRCLSPYDEVGSAATSDDEQAFDGNMATSPLPQGYQPEYPYLSTTPARLYRPRSSLVGSTLISRKELLGVDKRKNQL